MPWGMFGGHTRNIHPRRKHANATCGMEFWRGLLLPCQDESCFRNSCTVVTLWLSTWVWTLPVHDFLSSMLHIIPASKSLSNPRNIRSNGLALSISIEPCIAPDTCMSHTLWWWSPWSSPSEYLHCLLLQDPQVPGDPNPTVAEPVNHPS